MALRGGIRTPGLGEDIRGVPGIVPELVTQVLDERAQQSLVGWPVVAPYAVQQLVVGQDPSGKPGEFEQQPVLGRS